jgi:hypothetical protein
MLFLVVMVVVVAALGVASQLGWSVDSRDGADRCPTDAGVRAVTDLTAER